MITATASPPRHAPGPDVDGAEDRLGDARALEDAGHEDEQRHRDEHVVAHQREHAADDQRQPRHAEQDDREDHRDRAGREGERQAGQQDDDEDGDEEDAEELDAHRDVAAGRPAEVAQQVGDALQQQQQAGRAGSRT